MENINFKEIKKYNLFKILKFLVLQDILLIIEALIKK